MKKVLNKFNEQEVRLNRKAKNREEKMMSKELKEIYKIWASGSEYKYLGSYTVEFKKSHIDINGACRIDYSVPSIINMTGISSIWLKINAE